MLPDSGVSETWTSVKTPLTDTPVGDSTVSFCSAMNGLSKRQLLRDSPYLSKIININRTLPVLRILFRHCRENCYDVMQDTGQDFKQYHTDCILAEKTRINSNAPILLLFS